MAKLFGFSIEDSGEESKSVVSPVPPAQEDGNDHYITSGFLGHTLTLKEPIRTKLN